MALQEKYQSVVDAANQNGLTNLQVREQDNVLYFDGTAPSETAKTNVWGAYQAIDPEMRAGDMVMNITVDNSGSEEYEVKSGDSLSKIATHYEGISWKDIFEANKDTVSDPDKIFPGQKLRIPKK